MTGFSHFLGNPKGEIAIVFKCANIFGIIIWGHRVKVLGGCALLGVKVLVFLKGLFMGSHTQNLAQDHWS